MFNSITRRFGPILILAVSFALSGCGGGSGAPSTGSVLSGLDDAKKLFNALRSNVLSLDNKSETGFLQTQAQAMSDDFDNLQANGAFDFGQLLKALGEATQYISDASLSGGKPSETFVSDATSGDYYERLWGTPSYNSHLTAGCRYYTTSGAGLPNATPARTAAGAGNVRCWYFSDPVTQVVVRVSPGSSSSTFSYGMIVLTYSSPTCISYFTANCALSQSSSVAGSFDAIRNSSDWTSVALVNGKFIPWIQGATDSTVNLNWSLASANGTDTATITGSITSTNATDSSKSISFSLLPNSKMSWASATGAESATLIAQIKTGAFEYDGTFSLTGTSASRFSTSDDAVSSASFTGKVSTVSGSSVTGFLDGTITVNRNSTAPNIGKATFSAKVLNGSAVSDISGTLDNTTSGQTAISFTYNFGGSYSLTASGTKYDDASTPNTLTITSSDGTRIVVTQTHTPTGSSSTSAKVWDSSGSPIGSIAPDSNQVDFVDGTYLLLI